MNQLDRAGHPAGWPARFTTVVGWRPPRCAPVRAAAGDAPARLRVRADGAAGLLRVHRVQRPAPAGMGRPGQLPVPDRLARLPASHLEHAGPGQRAPRLGDPAVPALGRSSSVGAARTSCAPILFLPALLPALIVGRAFRLVLAENGPINAAFHGIGLDVLAQPWLSSETWVLPSLIAVIAWATMGTGVLLYSAGLSSLSRDYVEAAIVDGARWHQLVWSIYRPALAPVTRFWVLLLTIGTVTSFFPWVLGLTAGRTRHRVHHARLPGLSLRRPDESPGPRLRDRHRRGARRLRPARRPAAAPAAAGRRTSGDPGEGERRSCAGVPGS